jgi:hypothetical protein
MEGAYHLMNEISNTFCGFLLIILLVIILILPLVYTRRRPPIPGFYRLYHRSFSNAAGPRAAKVVIIILQSLAFVRHLGPRLPSQCRFVRCNH